MTLERITKNNIEFAIQIQEELFPGESGRANFEESLDENSGFEYYLLYEGGACVGVIGLSSYQEDRDSAWLGWFGIREEARRKHYGTLALKAFEEMAASRGYLFARLYTDAVDNDVAIAFYEANGYIEEPYENSLDPACVEHKTVIFSKALTNEPLIFWHSRNIHLTEQIAKQEKYGKGVKMDIVTRNYIDGLDKGSIPWNRMFTAYGTAEHYEELLTKLEQTTDTEQWMKAFNRMSDFEHQSTMFPPAPFALIFLVRILQKLLHDGSADEIVEKLVGQLVYYAKICSYAEKMEHAQPLGHFSDLLDDDNLLAEDCIDEELERVYGDPDAISDELFYSFYYYSGIVLSQVPDILDQCGKFPEESRKLRVTL